MTDARFPVIPADKLHVKPALPAADSMANRKIERHERREFLYSAVRDAMIRVGVLAANYKFKVLSLDVHGLQYLVMMDLSGQTAGDANRLTEIEGEIARTAKSRHDITVTAVYWRVNEQITAGLSPQHPIHPPAKEPQPFEKVMLQTKSAPAYEPLQEDEVAAFKQALAKVASAATPSAPGHLVTSKRRNPAPPVEFQDTKILPASPLSMTQYGDLS